MKRAAVDLSTTARFVNLREPVESSSFVVDGFTRILAAGYRKKCAFFSMKVCHLAGTAASTKIAETGQAGSHAPQSVQVAGSMNICG